VSAIVTIVRRYWHLGVSVILGALFCYAGAVKINNPLALADTIAAFGILPIVFVNPFALALPPFEILSGVLLIAGWQRRVGALALLIALAIYTSAIGTALLRGITIDCGCFGVGPATRGQMWWDLGRDLVLLAAAVAVYIRSLPSSAGRFFEKTA
jgi:putative oxidoreductase